MRCFVGLLLSLLLVLGCSESPKETPELNSVASPKNTPKTKEALPSSVPDEPAGNTATDGAKVIAGCMKGDKPIDTLIVWCLVAEKEKSLSEENKTQIAKVKAQYKQQHLTAAKLAIETQSSKGLIDAKLELIKVRKYFLPDVEYSALVEQANALEQKLQTNLPALINNQSAKEIWSDVEKAEKSKSVNEMCKALKKYLKFYPNESKAKAAKTKLEEQDAIVFVDCEL